MVWALPWSRCLASSCLNSRTRPIAGKCWVPFSEIAIEAGSPFGWTRYVRHEGDVVGMRSFGASGPAEALYQHFGITAERVVEVVRKRL